MTTEEEAAVTAVLKAPDHYAVVNAPHNASTQEIRRCYLQTSVKVHPDKNNHPDATKAFQRVAEAWTVLQDETARHRYDSALKSGQCGDSNAQAKNSHEGPSLNPVDAFAAFAFATAACAAASSSGMRGPSDFAETLFWAQRLSKMRSGETPDAATVATGSFALSAGIRTFGATARAAGLKDVSTTANSVANVVQGVGQVAAVGAIAAQIPAVREAITSGQSVASEKMQQLGAAVDDARTVASERVQQLGSAVDGARDTFRERAQQFRESETAANLGSMLGGVASWVQRARCRASENEGVNGPQTTHGSSASIENGQHLNNGSSCKASNELGASNASGGGQALLELPLGSQVILTGLQAAPHLNGQIGQIIGFDESSMRYRVSVRADQTIGGDEEVKRVRYENLKLVMNTIQSDK